MVHERNSFPHWNYFLALEDDLDRLSRFVEFTAQNYGCYSIELARILMLASAEIDVVAKQLCKQIAPDLRADNIHEYRTTILSTYTSFPKNSVFIPRHGLELHPWSQWSGIESPIWWCAHNSVKHNRHTHYSDANLENALNAVGALLLITIYFHGSPAREGKLSPNPKLYQVGKPIVVDRLFWGDRTNTYAIQSDD